MYRWLWVALAGVGAVGMYQYHGWSADANVITVYAISGRTCPLEQQKADRLVAQLKQAGVPYTLRYVDHDGAAEFSRKVREFLAKQEISGGLGVGFPVVAVRDALLFDAPTLDVIQKHR